MPFKLFSIFRAFPSTFSGICNGKEKIERKFVWLRPRAPETFITLYAKQPALWIYGNFPCGGKFPNCKQKSHFNDILMYLNEKQRKSN